MTFGIGLFLLVQAAAAQTEAAATPETAVAPAETIEPAEPLSQVEQPVPAPQPAVAEPGKIVMYRGSSIIGAGVACPIRYKGKEVVELGRGKYAELAVPAGRYVLNNKTSSVEVTVAAGDTSYVRCQIKPGFMTGRADLQIVDAESYNEKSKDFEKKDAVNPL